MTSALEPRKKPKQARSAHLVECVVEATARVLAAHGYAGTSTNLIAAEAGVSVGSLYQYFPNKEALIVAVHERHVEQIGQVMDAILGGCRTGALPDYIAAMVRAALAAHLVDPRLHRVLEYEVPFVEMTKDHGEISRAAHARVQKWLEEWRDTIAPPNLDLAAWVVLQTIRSLVHAAVLDPLPQFTIPDIEQAITNVVLGYLCYRPARDGGARAPRQVPDA